MEFKPVFKQLVVTGCCSAFEGQCTYAVPVLKPNVNMTQLKNIG
jgi:hypothetical protein